MKGSACIGRLTLKTGFPDPELIREQIIDTASFAAWKEGIPLQRYEGQIERSFRSNLKELLNLVKTGLDRVEDDEPEAVEVGPEAIPQNKAARIRMLSFKIFSRSQF